MPALSDAPAPPAPSLASRPDGTDHEIRSAVARAILAHALALGVAADLLLRNGLTGPGYPVWLALLALGAISLATQRARALPREAVAWLVTAVGFGAGMTWRDAGQLQFVDFVATIFSLGMAAVALGDRRSALFAARMRDTIWAGGVVVASVAGGVVSLLLRDLAPAPGAPRVPGTTTRARYGPPLRATLIALPLVLVFGALLRDADPVFASIVRLPDVDLGVLVSHVALTGLFAWVVAGWARGALLSNLAPGRAPDRLPFELGTLDVTVALGALTALFALYVATQLGWLFGGERFLQERTGLTAAQYAREGFFQMVWVTILVVPLLLTTRAALRPDRALERRHTVLALPLVILLGAMIMSAVLRMRLYVQYFGLTLERLYPLVVMAWLAAVLVWMTLTVLRGDGRRFAAGAALMGLATIALLNVAVPDLIVARVNLARAERGAPLDLAHLARLSGETMPLVVPALLAPPPLTAPPAADSTREARCDAARRLLRSWGPSSRRAARRDGETAWWRAWNRGEAVAIATVGRHVTALRELQHASCARGAARSPARENPARE